MAFWPAGFDPHLGYGGALAGGMDPYAYAGTYGGTPSAFFDPLWAPGATPGTRRRLAAPQGGDKSGGAPQEGGAGGGGAEAGGEGGEEEERGRRHMRDPHVVGPAGWTRSIPTDFVEREAEYVVRADIPGCKKSEIHVEAFIKDGAPVLRFGHNPHAEREKEDEEEQGIFHRAERISTFRNRNLRLPEDADIDNVGQASYEDGVLTVTIPKKEAGRAQGRVLEIL